jgi:hypothetical protein
MFEKSWICKPNGDSGGRPVKDTAKYLGSRVSCHLHPDGKACDLAHLRLLIMA